MAQDKTRLPEGTDKVIGGASSTGGGTAGGGDHEVALVNETAVTGANQPESGGTGSRPFGSGGGGQSGGGFGESSGNIKEKIRSGGEKLQGQAADKARGFVSQGLERSSEGLSNVSKLVSDTASGLDERLGPEYGDYARRAADTIDNFADNLANKDPDELIDDTRNFVRKSPGVALAGAAIVGFALARLVKTGLTGPDRNDEPLAAGRTSMQGSQRAAGTGGTTGPATGETGSTGFGASGQAGTTGGTGQF